MGGMSMPLTPDLYTVRKRVSARQTQPLYCQYVYFSYNVTLPFSTHPPLPILTSGLLRSHPRHTSDPPLLSPCVWVVQANSASTGVTFFVTIIFE